MEGRKMCNASQSPQIQILIQMPVDVLEYPMHPRRVFR